MVQQKKVSDLHLNLTSSDADINLDSTTEYEIYTSVTTFKFFPFNSDLYSESSNLILILSGLGTKLYVSEGIDLFLYIQIFLQFKISKEEISI